MAQRPTGVIVVSVLHVLFGLVHFALLFVPGMVDRLGVLSNEPNEYIVICLVATALLGVLSGLGMWWGASWGWLLGGLYYTYLIFRSTADLVRIVEQGGLQGLADLQRFGMVYWSLALGLVMLYFFFLGARVVEYFGLGGQSRARLTVKLLVAGVVVALIQGFLAGGFYR